MFQFHGSKKSHTHSVFKYTKVPNSFCSESTHAKFLLRISAWSVDSFLILRVHTFEKVLNARNFNQCRVN